MKHPYDGIQIKLSIDDKQIYDYPPKLKIITIRGKKKYIEEIGLDILSELPNYTHYHNEISVISDMINNSIHSILKQKEKITINAENYIFGNVKGLIGRDNGKIFINLILKDNPKFTQNLINNTNQYTIKFPKTISMINKSFFMGAFKEIIKDLGRDKFIKHVNFDTHPLIKKDLKSFTYSIR